MEALLMALVSLTILDQRTSPKRRGGLAPGGG